MKEKIFINQSKHTKEILKKFGLKDSKSLDIPMSSICKLDKDVKRKKIFQKLYRDMIGSLLYLTASRPDIMYSTCMCARFQSDPIESHLIVVKKDYKIS